MTNDAKAFELAELAARLEAEILKVGVNRNISLDFQLDDSFVKIHTELDNYENGRGSIVTRRSIVTEVGSIG